MKNRMFYKKSNIFGQIKSSFFFWLHVSFTETAGNKQVDLIKIENFVRSNVFLNIYQKINERKLISEFWNNLKMIDGHIAYKVKRKVILASDKKRIILPNVHEGLGDEPKTKTLAA